MIKKSILKGFIGSAALLLFYFLTLTLVSGWDFAQVQFSQNWYWILGLSFGFGIQVGLFVFLRGLRERASGGAMAVSGATSGAAMVACCSHYLVNILPVIGVAGLATIIGQYQTELFLVGLISNLAGISYLAYKLIGVFKNKRQ